MDYHAVKLVHQGAVVVSLAGFIVRGGASLFGARWVNSRLAKTLPHVVDSVLLFSAVTLAWMLQLSPSNAQWMLAKILGLVVYIGLGVVALRPGRSTQVRATAWVAALATAGWIVSVGESSLLRSGQMTCPLAGCGASNNSITSTAVAKLAASGMVLPLHDFAR